jgi:FkbM family methyltransferase
MIKVLAKRIIAGIVSILSKSVVGQYLYQQVIDSAMSIKATVDFNSVHMNFAVPNRLCRYRVETFATKEPETLEWIDSIPVESVVWDVGANIGLYSIYAAKARNCRVYAFEPSVFNLELLARNIYLNGLQNQITIVPVALSDKVGASLFKMSTTTWGGALSTFGQDFDQNGMAMNSLFEYRTYGVSITDAVALLGVTPPQHVKIDVDGIEHFILRGGKGVLANVDSVLIEINDDFREQAEESSRHLMEAGLSLYRKCSLGLPNQYNQWWTRKAAAAPTIRTSR